MKDSTPITQIKGIGDKTKQLFERLDITSVGQLLHHYPRDYEQFGSPVSIAELSVGETCAVQGFVMGTPTLKKIRSLSILNVIIRDSTGAIHLTFFNMPFLKKTLHPGIEYVFRGLIQSRGADKIMEQPKIFKPEEYEKQLAVLQPRYSLTKGLTNQGIQKAIHTALGLYEFGDEIYPAEIVNSCGLMSTREALQEIHFPISYESMLSARKRFVFDEFFTFLLRLRQNKDISNQLPNQYVLFETADTVRFQEQLPFSLTKGQKKVWQEIRNDCASEFCMNRLIQGDVGSGKTIVAVLALLMCVANGYQGAFMAPTEVLALQHFENIREYIAKYKLAFQPILLIGAMSATEKKKAYEQIASGEANLIIGTHALIQERVVYKNLALVVTDEQHRFGVRQRESLVNKGNAPHVLVMSATPIPRTLAIILYGDMHLSVIDELPANRLPIKNCVVNTTFRPKAYSFIEKEVKEGRQAYVICPMVEEGEAQELENVVDYAGKLRAALPEDIRIAYLHGKMSSTKKSQIMEHFGKGEIDVLVSTTVIEVGINVPNATVMMVENAERFGLAQLHQLRGRVGRGEHQSYCIFMSTNEKKETMKRLEILNQSNDGFYIASEDLKLRGPGEMLGIRQSGEFAFQIGDVYTDAATLEEASAMVDLLLNEDPHLELPHNMSLRQHFMNDSSNSVDFRTI